MQRKTEQFMRAQYRILTDSEPMMLERLSRLLDRQKPKISGLIIETEGKKATVQFTAPHDESLRTSLRKHGFRATEQVTLSWPRRAECEELDCRHGQTPG